MYVSAGIRVLLISAVGLGGCGLFVPEKSLFQPTKESQADFENLIISNIKCELHKGVRDALTYFDQAPLAKRVDWLASWGATATLKISVDEKSQLNPSLNWDPAGAFSLGLGASTSANATRTEIIAFTYAFADLLRDRPVTQCENVNGILIQSDLKIGQFIFDKAFVASVPGTVGEKNDKASPFSVFNYQVTFVVSVGGGATPSWTFARVNVNPESPFLSASRTQTHDLTLTLGPAKPATRFVPAQISGEARAVHEAALIGQSVATSIQSRQR